MNLGEKIINLRKKEGMTQEELAGKLNVSRQTISKWELCQSHPELSFIVKLSELFGVTTDYLIKDEEVVSQSTNEEAEPHMAEAVSVEKGLNTRQIAGIIIASLGGLLTIISILMLARSEDFILGIIGGVVVAIVGFELLLIKKNFALKILWTIWFIICMPMGMFVVNSISSPFSFNTMGGIMSCISLASFVILIIATIINKFKKNTSGD